MVVGQGRTTRSTKKEGPPPCCCVCGITNNKLSRCSRCKFRLYCGVSCQRKDWSEGGHKKTCCTDKLEHVLLSAVARALEDHAVTAEEVRMGGLSPLALNRQIGNMFMASLDNPAHEEQAEATLPKARIMSILWQLDMLFAEGRGIRLDDPDNVDWNGAIGFVVGNVGSEASTKRRYRVELDHPTDMRRTTTLTVEATQLRVLPINDPRHTKNSMDFEDRPPTLSPEQDPDSVVPERDDDDPNTFLAPGVSWEYFDDRTGSWVMYKPGLALRIEGLFTSGSPHFLYRPGNPHCEGSFGVVHGQSTYDGIGVGNPSLNHHDYASRRILFDTQHFDRMTELDLYTGMKRRVRRVGPAPPPPTHNPMAECWDAAATSGVRWDTPRQCGLCGSTDGPFEVTECCGNLVCDAEDRYEIGSYEREGQCGRNHRYNSICSYHHHEGHDGDWKTCRRCEGHDFHPYDYAVKATSQAVSGTVRRYNFENNVRVDVHPADVAFPTCGVCDNPCDTTEETTRTLSMRRLMGDGKCYCNQHGGGFGRVQMRG